MKPEQIIFTAVLIVGGMLTAFTRAPTSRVASVDQAEAPLAAANDDLAAPTSPVEQSAGGVSLEPKESDDIQLQHREAGQTAAYVAQWPGDSSAAPAPVYRATGHWETRRAGLFGRQSYRVWVTGEPQPIQWRQPDGTWCADGSCGGRR